MIAKIDNISTLEWFRPRGKIVCIGNLLSKEITIIHDYMDSKEEARLPMLLLTKNQTNSNKDDRCDQVVIYNSETLLPDVNSLLNSYFLFFIINSSDPEIFGILGSILASIKFSGSIPIIIDTGVGLEAFQKNKIGGCYFHFDFSIEKNPWYFLILLDSIISALQNSSDIKISFSDLICSFGNSRSLFYGISSSTDLEEALNSVINSIGNNLVDAEPEHIEKLEMIFLSINSSNPLSIQQMNFISHKILNTFGKDFELRISNSIDPKAQGYNNVAIITDLHPIEDIIPRSTLRNSSEFSFTKEIQPSGEKKDLNYSIPPNDKYNEDERYSILGKIFKNSEVYIFDDGGLPLFASHRPAGQEVCLYTGLFSAIQSMSSDLIGHTPDHLTAGDKRCVFITQNEPNNAQLRGVAICLEGFEQNARKDLISSMNLVRELLQKGEPEYSINDKIQGLLVQGYYNGAISNILDKEFHAS